MDALPSPLPAADFVLPTPEGSSIALGDYRGRHLLVNFWAYWCAPCVDELPAMQRLYTELAAQAVAVLAIHAGPYTVAAQSIVDRFQLTFDIAIDSQTALQGWAVPALPVSYLVNPTGQVTHRALGPRPWERTAFQPLLRAREPAEAGS